MAVLAWLPTDCRLYRQEFPDLQAVTFDLPRSRERETHRVDRGYTHNTNVLMMVTGVSLSLSPKSWGARDEKGGRNSITDVPEETRHHRESEDTWDTRRPAHYTCTGEAWKEPVTWPATATKKEWEIFDHDVDQVLEAAIAGDEEGAVSQIQHPAKGKHLKEIAILRSDLRRLKKAFREATEVEKPALIKLRDNLRECIKILRQAECHHRDRKRRTKERCYFEKFNMRFTCGDFTTDRQRLESNQQRSYVRVLYIQQAPIRAFMDDLTITAKSVPQGRWILEDLVELTDWARMEFKPAKSRSLVLRRGHVQDRFLFKITEDIIPTGRLQRQGECEGEEEIQAETWMTPLENSGLPGKYKAWGYQYGVLPRLVWPLLVYEVPVSTVDGLKRKMNTYLRRWLASQEASASLTCTAQAASCSCLQDARVHQADIEIRTGHKWSASTALKGAEDRQHHQAGRGGILGNLDKVE
ncbi:hypothetical protein N1851_028657 [Merluccius polli]|uniref:Uncharacterized protein n=1 Tax=Merluccius polli TaxID=89951 RepID=A0AA47NTB7_MERPO|nr:hypothetical protein N1851_028657 [Merluccius polli]